MLGILVVDDHRVTADALSIALRVDSFEVESIDPSKESVAEIVEMTNASSPSVVLLHLRLSGGHSTLALVRALVGSEAVVLIVSPLDDDALLGECLIRGAEAVFGRSISLAEVAEGIRRTMRGERAMPETLRVALIQQAAQARHEAKRDARLLGTLTRREQEVLKHLTLGRRVSDIAELMSARESTVRTHVKRILGKLGVGTQTAAAVLALRAGWFEEL